MLTDQQIADGKAATRYSLGGREVHHEHNDCIRMAYEWLDAQKKISGPTKHSWALKHMVERWSGRYVSQSDVEVAATIHPDIHGKYPYYNLSSRLTLPSDRILEGIGEAFKHEYREDLNRSSYKVFEK